jgi:MoaA/NifB/PqqE/SkfB family radical SAM enzyme
MSFEEIKTMSETSPKFDKLWLSGGEPFLREELVDIIKLFYDNNNSRVINLPTNGLLPKKIDEGIGRLLKECPELSIHLNFSIDGLGETHDKIRGVRGNFKKTIASMELIKQKYGDNPKLLQNVATVVTPEALDEMFDLGVYLLKKDLISTQFFEVVRGDPKDPATKGLSKEQIDSFRKKVFPLIEEQADRLFKDFGGAKKKLAKTYFLGFVRFVNSLQDDNYFGPKHWGMSCTAGKTTIVVDHNGSFRSCEIRPPVGKMQDYDFNVTKALYSEAMKQEIEEIGGGSKANCWCTHGCWLMSSLKFNPRALLFRIPWAYYKSKPDRIQNFELPDIDIEAIESY